jgi:hypothetical protein
MGAIICLSSMKKQNKVNANGLNSSMKKQNKVNANGLIHP